MGNESNVTNTITGSNYTGLLSGTSTANVLIDRWYIGEKAKEKIKNDLFSTLEGHEYKVRIDHADIIIDGIKRNGYHLIVSNDLYTYTLPNWYYSSPQKMEITC